MLQQEKTFNQGCVARMEVMGNGEIESPVISQLAVSKTQHGTIRCNPTPSCKVNDGVDIRHSISI